MAHFSGGSHMKNYKLALLLTTLLTSPTLAQFQTATITGGTIKGAIDNDLSIFKAIPFAAPPVGDLRWKAPQPVIPWTGTKDATNFAAPPMQNNTPRGSEDCL